MSSQGARVRGLASPKPAGEGGCEGARVQVREGARACLFEAGRRRRVRPSWLWGLAACLVVLILPLPAFAAAEDGRKIVEEAQKRAASTSHRYEGLLQAFDSNGKSTDKSWVYERLGTHGQSKVVIRFTAPAEVRGVALLIVNDRERASDQWMWTPALERDRRIALQDRSTRFFGTDFSFEDLEERDVDQYDYTVLREDTIDGAACWVVQSVPRQTKSSQYTRSVVWIRKDNYAYARVDSFIKNELVRRLNYSDIRATQGIWTARTMTMMDLRRRTRTRLTLTEVEYNLPLKEDAFTLQALRRQ